MDNRNEALSLTAVNLILPIAKDLVMPKIQRVISKTKSKASFEETSIILQQYIQNKYVQYSFIDTIAFSNMQTLFDVLYEPLVIYSHQQKEENLEYVIDKFPEEMFSNYYRIVIEDTGGMGKSTILKKIFKTAIEDKKYIPILIFLSKVNSNNSIMNEIINQINDGGEANMSKPIDELLRDGEFVILFDGFDEISNANREYTINNLHSFVRKYNNNYYVISTRPEDSIASFGDFRKFNVKPLDKNTAYNIIKKYDYYNYKKIANMLMTKIDDDRNKDLREYLKNPFLVSLLYKSFDYTKDIPLKKTHFYSQVYNALFEQHDLSKETYLTRKKYSGLHLYDFERVLRWLGFMTLQNNAVEYDKEQMLKIISDIRSYNSEIDFVPTDYLKDLLETVPLFRKDGNYIRWAHKSLQGYFAAKFIWIDAKEKQIGILKRMYDDKNNKRYIPIFDLFYELDPHAFESTVLLWFLSEFVEYMERSRSEIKDLDHVDVDIIANAVFCGSCVVARASNRLKFYKESNEDSKRLKAMTVIGRIPSLGNGTHIKTSIIDYRDIEASFIVNYGNSCNLTSIREFVMSKFPYLLMEEYEERLEDKSKMLILDQKNNHEVACLNENFFISQGLGKALAGLLSTEDNLDYEKCWKKLQDIKGKKSRDNVFDW